MTLIGLSSENGEFETGGFEAYSKNGFGLDLMLSRHGSVWL